METSCDETAAAVVDEQGHVLSDVVRSQIEAHAPYGGIVPEIAARDHLRAITPVIDKALADAGIGAADLSAVAATYRPGLVGALIVGLQAAKGFAWGANKPLVGVDHLVGHLLSPFLQRGEEPASQPRYPFVALLVSGGHTALYRVGAPRLDAIVELGATRDDAVGEAFDKVAKVMGLGYPGGPVIDRLAAAGDAARAPIELPSPMPGSLEFSFSGIKSAMARHLKSDAAPRDEQALADLCAAFQAAITKTLVKKAVLALRRERLEELVVAGGVAANRELRTRMAAAAERHGFRLSVPPFASCTDNAAMIAYAGAQRLLEHPEGEGLGISPAPRTALPRQTRKGRGKR
ncbi:MAG: tRNA (adenosine(37)-N6)-threonylcarbamoyltransferase complex transferase subunit TsaD [Polyangiaceae bacterium]